MNPSFDLRKPKSRVGGLWCLLLMRPEDWGQAVHGHCSGSVNIWDPEPLIFFLHHPEQVTSILKVACSHKKAVAAPAIASSSPSRKKETAGKGQEGTCQPTFQSHSIIFISISTSIIFLLRNSGCNSNHLVLTNGSRSAARWGSDLFSSLWFQDPGEKSNCQGQSLLGGRKEPKRSEQRHRGLLQSYPPQPPQWKPEQA